VNQQLFHDFANLLAANKWCHIFPEGGIWQKDNNLGGRDNIYNQDGKMIGNDDDHDHDDDDDDHLYMMIMRRRK